MNSAPSSSGPDDLQSVGDRIEHLLSEIRSSTDDAAWLDVEELVRLLTDLYGEGLARAIALGDDEFPSRLAADELVGSLMLLHGLHPDDLAGRVQRAVDSLAPGIRKGGGNVEVTSVSSGDVRVVFTSAGGCGSTASTIREQVLKAVWDAAPDAASVVVEMVVDDTPKLTPVRLGTKRVATGASAGFS